jgi:GTP-binding protein Era
LRKYPAKIDKSKSRAYQIIKQRKALKIRPMLNSRYMETSEMTFHQKPSSFNISEPYEVPDEINLNLQDFKYEFEKIENSKFMKVGIVGPINAGKSSLLNKLIGKQLSAVSGKRNTTMENIKGILSSVKDKSQIVFYDIPGFARVTGSQSKHSEYLRNQKDLRDQNKILFIVDGNIRPKETWVKDIMFLKALGDSGIGIILVVNKMDLIYNKRKLSDIIEMFENYLNFEKIFMISCETGFGLDQLTDYLHGNNINGKWLYPDQITSEYNEKDLMYEIIKSCLFERVYKEIPYLLAYEIKEFHVKNTHIKMVIQVNVNKKNQVAMIVGKRGNNIRAISEEIQTRLAHLYNREVQVGIVVAVGNLNPVEVKVLKGDNLHNVEQSIETAKDSKRRKVNLPKNFN